MTFQVTIRYGSRHQRYHSYRVEADDLVQALRAAADAAPEHVVEEADLAEVRPVVRDEDREYVGGS
ncbi:MAG: hypothetical protein ACOC8K_03470 [Gemmatimonadota bacterium]